MDFLVEDWIMFRPEQGENFHSQEMGHVLAMMYRISQKVIDAV
jgi:hypothetical protein